MSVGRLDYMSEGLLVITNDGELSRALEKPSFKIERDYRVLVQGRPMTRHIIDDMCKGCKIDGINYGPYDIEWVRESTCLYKFEEDIRKSWVFMRLQQGKNNEIRRVMNEFDFDVLRIKRIRYGPFKLNDHVPDEDSLMEVEPPSEIYGLLNHYYK